MNANRKASFADLSRDDLQGLYDHLGTMPFVRGSWSNNWRAALSEALHCAPRPELWSAVVAVEGREGFVTVWGHAGRHLGCMGVETWERLLREAAKAE